MEIEEFMNGDSHKQYGPVPNQQGWEKHQKISELNHELSLLKRKKLNKKASPQEEEELIHQQQQIEQNILNVELKYQKDMQQMLQQKQQQVQEEQQQLHQKETVILEDMEYYKKKQRELKSILYDVDRGMQILDNSKSSNGVTNLQLQQYELRKYLVDDQRRKQKQSEQLPQKLKDLQQMIEKLNHQEDQLRGEEKQHDQRIQELDQQLKDQIQQHQQDRQQLKLDQLRKVFEQDLNQQKQDLEKQSQKQIKELEIKFEQKLQLQQEQQNELEAQAQELLNLLKLHKKEEAEWLQDHEEKLVLFEHQLQLYQDQEEKKHKSQIEKRNKYILELHGQQYQLKKQIVQLDIQWQAKLKDQQQQQQQEQQEQQVEKDQSRHENIPIQEEESNVLDKSISNDLIGKTRLDTLEVFKEKDATVIKREEKYLIDEQEKQQEQVERDLSRKGSVPLQKECDLLDNGSKSIDSGLKTKAEVLAVLLEKSALVVESGDTEELDRLDENILKLIETSKDYLSVNKGLLQNELKKDKALETHMNPKLYGGCNIPDELTEKATLLRVLTDKAMNEYHLMKEELVTHTPDIKHLTKGESVLPWWLPDYGIETRIQAIERINMTHDAYIKIRDLMKNHITTCTHLIKELINFNKRLTDLCAARKQKLQKIIKDLSSKLSVTPIEPQASCTQLSSADSSEENNHPCVNSSPCKITQFVTSTMVYAALILMSFFVIITPFLFCIEEVLLGRNHTHHTNMWISEWTLDRQHVDMIDMGRVNILLY